MSTGASLSELMNAMISHLEYTQPEEMDFAHESKKWEMIGTYVSVDPVLASLYKEYCAAKENLGKLLIDKGAQDPMTEIAWDVHDSLRSAIETRLLELQEDGTVSARILAIQRSKFASMMPVRTLKKPKIKETQTLNDMMAFMIWAGMVMQNNPASYDIRRDFSRAS